MKKPFGLDTYLYTISDGIIQVNITNYGATIVNIYAPDKNNKKDDIILGYSCAQDYAKYNSNQGATIGRYANRIKNGAFTLNGQTYHLAKNDGENHLHGGMKGFHKQIWQEKKYESNCLVLSYHSADGEEGYPGDLFVAITFTIQDRTLNISYKAKSDRDTIVNLTNHSYFKLGGNAMNTMLKINADKIAEVDEQLIPTGNLYHVKQTPFDFTEYKPIGKDIHTNHTQLLYGHGYDCSFLLNSGTPAAQAFDPITGRMITISTDMPAIQLYTANFLDGSEIGKNQQPLLYRSAFCLETQFLPNTPNVPIFPSCILKKEDTYLSQTAYKFTIK